MLWVSRRKPDDLDLHDSIRGGADILGRIALLRSFSEEKCAAGQS